jgi:hypothetical protein
MNFAIKKGWAPALVVAVVMIVAFLPGDAVTEFLALLQIFLLTVLALVVLSRVLPVATWPSPKQRLVSWSVAVCASVLVCLEPLVLSALKR